MRIGIPDKLPAGLAVDAVVGSKYDDYGSFIARKGLRDQITGHDKIKRVGVATAIPLALARGAGFLSGGLRPKGLGKSLPALSLLGVGSHTAAKYMQLKSDDIDKSTRYRNLAMGLGVMPAAYSTYVGIRNLKRLGRSSGLGKRLLAASPIPLAASYFALPMIFGKMKASKGSVDLGVRMQDGRVELFNKKNKIG